MKRGRRLDYCLDEGADAILSLYEQPQSIGDVVSLLQSIDANASDQQTFLNDLVEIGVLIPANAQVFADAPVPCGFENAKAASSTSLRMATRNSNC
jgi:hypothetical protein